MDSPEDLNRKLNRALRHANLAAVTVADLQTELRRPLLDALTNVIVELSAAQRSLFAEHPELEWHFEAGRPPTKFMQQIHSLADEAESALEAGSRVAAVAKLQEALSLEPHPLPYESLEKRRDELLADA